MAKKALAITDEQFTESLSSLAKTLPEKASKKGYRDNCKLYNCKFRKEAEAEYERTGNVSHVFRFLKDNGVEISRPAVARYFRNYYYSEDVAESVQSFIEDLEPWINLRISKEDRLRNQLAMNDKLIAELQAMTPANNIAEMRKTTDQIVKLQNVSLGIQKQIDEIHAGMEPVHIIIEKFSNIVSLQMSNITSPEAKQVLKDVVLALQEEVEELEIG